MLTQKHNLGPLIAGIGALLALIAFFALDYVSLHINVSALGISRDVGGSLKASDVADHLNYGIIWLAVVLAVVGLVIAGYQLITNTSSKNPNARSLSRWLALGLIVAGAGIIAVNVYIATDAPNKTPAIIKSLALGDNPLGNLVNVTASVSLAAGGWMLIIGAVLLIVGGVLGLIFKPAFQEALGNVPAWPAQGQVPVWPAPQQETPTQYGQPPYTQQPNQPPYQPPQQPPPQPPQW